MPIRHILIVALLVLASQSAAESRGGPSFGGAVIFSDAIIPLLTIGSLVLAVMVGVLFYIAWLGRKVDRLVSDFRRLSRPDMVHEEFGAMLRKCGCGLSYTQEGMEVTHGILWFRKQWVLNIPKPKVVEEGSVRQDDVGMEGIGPRSRSVHFLVTVRSVLFAVILLVFCVTLGVAIFVFVTTVENVRLFRIGPALYLNAWSLAVLLPTGMHLCWYGRTYQRKLITGLMAAIGYLSLFLAVILLLYFAWHDQTTIDAGSLWWGWLWFSASLTGFAALATSVLVTLRGGR